MFEFTLIFTAVTLLAAWVFAFMNLAMQTKNDRLGIVFLLLAMLPMFVVLTLAIQGLINSL